MTLHRNLEFSPSLHPLGNGILTTISAGNVQHAAGSWYKCTFQKPNGIMFQKVTPCHPVETTWAYQLWLSGYEKQMVAHQLHVGYPWLNSAQLCPTHNHQFHKAQKICYTSDLIPSLPRDICPLSSSTPLGSANFPHLCLSTAKQPATPLPSSSQFGKKAR